MTHPVFIAEGYYGDILKFLEHFNGKDYANGKAKARARMILPIHFSINESGYEEFLSDIKSFTVNSDFPTKIHTWKNTGDTGQGLKNKMRKIIKWVRKFFPQIKDLETDINKVKCNDTRKKLGQKGKHFLMSIHPVGRVDDARYPDGREVV